MISIQNFNKKWVATLKAKRNKVIKVINNQQNYFCVTKIMTFEIYDQFMWVQNQIRERLEVLQRINNIGILNIIQKGIVEVEVKQGQKEKTFFLTKRQTIGPTLLRIVQRENLAIDILMNENLKQIIWSILALIVGGGGYGNLIISLQNLIFEQIGDNYKPTLNYFSLCGIQLLKFKKHIKKEQYLEIAMFLDEDTIQSGDLNRFQFKARNFALLILSLFLRRDPHGYIFHNVEIESDIGISQAKQLYRKYVKPRINQLLQFKKLQATYKKLNIPGLQDFIKSVLNYEPKDQNTSRSDWNVVQRMLLQNNTSLQENNINRIPRLLWQQQQEWVRNMLQSRGLGIGQNGQNIYMAFKISAHLQVLLQQNDWQNMMRRLQYNYKTHEMFFRLLKCTTLKNSKVLEQSMHELVKVSKEAFKTVGTINDREVVTQSNLGSIINQYMRFF